ncbi:ty3-gypsy retrotransposon protein, partial [Tanacetum coccineum]
LPDFKDTFVIEADASAVGIGAVLLQKRQPLDYFSRKLGPRIRIVVTYQKELFVIVEVVYKWHQYLLGRWFTIHSDHRSIKELMQQVIQTPLQQKHVRKLMGFDFVIEYKPGSENFVADALSRVFEEDEDATTTFMALICLIVGLLEDLRRENVTLDELCQIHLLLDQGKVLEGFQREQGLILFRGHGGSKKMLVGLAALFYWKGMRRENLFAARNRMEMQANRSRRKVKFNVGDKVLVKLHPYRQITLAKWISNKLSKRYNGPFKVLKRVGKVVYRLNLPSTSKKHPVFHVSLLKPFTRFDVEGIANLHKEEHEGHPVDQPLVVCATRVILRNGKPICQILVQWLGSSPEEATWEELSEFQTTYSFCHLEDKVNFEGEESVTPVLQENGRPGRAQRKKSKPVWHKNYVI